jgi:glycerol-3-phosphate dehydrogenase (NAD(P)+)
MASRPSAAAVIGAGSWGTALARHLSLCGWQVRLWGRDATAVERMRITRENERYLPGVPIPDGVMVTPDAGLALQAARLIVVAVPSHFVEDVLARVRVPLLDDAVLVSATKGIEPRGRRISQVLSAAFPGHSVAALSGPSFAREVAQGLPAALVVASLDMGIGAQLQQWLASSTLRIYTNRDMVGVELGGALKNVMAIATGLSDGIALGDSARAALITRGLAEIARLGVAMGAQASTFLGLAGLGDLVLTCTGALSRNRTLGLRIAGGQSLAEAERGTTMVAEGVRTVRAALSLAAQAGVSMPISAEVAAVLFENKPVADALRSLLSREPRPEEEPVAGGASRA